jgi:nitrogen fixation protein
MKSIKVTLLSCTLLGLSGCAHVEVRHVPPADVSDGVHFYEPRPYLLITDQVRRDDKGVDQHSLTSTIIYLPDKTRHYVVKVRPGWGTVNGSVKLADGWRLESLGAQSDAKGPETITAVSGLLREASGVALMSRDVTRAPGLYLIDIQPSGTVKLVPQAGWKID